MMMMTMMKKYLPIARELSPWSVTSGRRELEEDSRMSEDEEERVEVEELDEKGEIRGGEVERDVVWTNRIRSGGGGSHDFDPVVSTVEMRPSLSQDEINQVLLTNQDRSFQSGIRRMNPGPSSLPSHATFTPMHVLDRLYGHGAWAKVTTATGWQYVQQRMPVMQQIASGLRQNSERVGDLYLMSGNRSAMYQAAHGLHSPSTEQDEMPSTNVPNELADRLASRHQALMTPRSQASKSIVSAAPEHYHSLAADADRDRGIGGGYDASRATDQGPRSSTPNAIRAGTSTTTKRCFRCPQCSYATDRKNNLKRHLGTMHRDCGKTLRCCDVTFSSKAALREHISWWHRAGYACHRCLRSFSRKALLNRHLGVHDLLSRNDGARGSGSRGGGCCAVEGATGGVARNNATKSACNVNAASSPNCTSHDNGRSCTSSAEMPTVASSRGINTNDSYRAFYHEKTSQIETLPILRYRGHHDDDAINDGNGTNDILSAAISSSLYVGVPNHMSSPKSSPNADATGHIKRCWIDVVETDDGGDDDDNEDDSQNITNGGQHRLPTAMMFGWDKIQQGTGMATFHDQLFRVESRREQKNIQANGGGEFPGSSRVLFHGPDMETFKARNYSDRETDIFWGKAAGQPQPELCHMGQTYSMAAEIDRRPTPCACIDHYQPPPTYVVKTTTPTVTSESISNEPTTGLCNFRYEVGGATSGNQQITFQTCSNAPVARLGSDSIRRSQVSRYDDDDTADDTRRSLPVTVRGYRARSLFHNRLEMTYGAVSDRRQRRAPSTDQSVERRRVTSENQVIAENCSTASILPCRPASIELSSDVRDSDGHGDGTRVRRPVTLESMRYIANLDNRPHPAACRPISECILTDDEEGTIINTELVEENQVNQKGAQPEDHDDFGCRITETMDFVIDLSDGEAKTEDKMAERILAGGILEAMRTRRCRSLRSNETRLCVNAYKCQKCGREFRNQRCMIEHENIDETKDYCTS